MRTFLSTIIAFLLTVSFVSHSTAQDMKAATQKAASPSTETQTHQPKNEVDLILDEAKNKGEIVLAACLEKCKDSKERITGGVVAGHAIELPQPLYPALARRAHASGEVRVQLIIDKDGKVIATHAVSGHPLLLAAAVKAAKDARFTPSLWEGQPVKVVGVIIYNFVSQ